jgi:hypothetical protein
MTVTRWGVRAVDTGFVRVYINGQLFDFNPHAAADLAQTIRVILGIETPGDDGPKKARNAGESPSGDLPRSLPPATADGEVQPTPETTADAPKGGED